MPSPFGHALIGYTLARELGFPPRQAALAGTLAMLPDIDIPIGLAMKRDLFAFHRKGTHSMLFAAATGILAHLLHRRLRPGAGDNAAAETGFLVHLAVVSHIMADRVGWPQLNRAEAVTHDKVTRNLKSAAVWEGLNAFLDVAYFGVPALILARRRAKRRGVAKPAAGGTLEPVDSPAWSRQGPGAGPERN